MIEDADFIVETGGIRLDAALLSRFPSSTRAFCRTACAEGDVSVNGRPAIKGQKLQGGERIHVRRLAEASDNRVAPNPAVHVRCVFEDAALLAFDKPAAQPVQPLTYRETGTLMNGVVAHWLDVRDVGDQPLMAGALHRIDADTSGLVLVARTPAAFEALRAQFAAQTVKKTYLALVEGSVAVGGTLENDLVHDPTLPGNEERTLLEVTIYTGVTHQIRAQLALAGMHIVNDRLYGAFAVENQVGHCLHALAASFRHPVSNDEMEIRTPYPDWGHVQ